MILTVSILLTSGTVCHAIAAPAKTEKGYVKGYKISQYNKLQGKGTVFIAADGIKLQSEKTGIYVLFVPPYRQVAAANPTNKKICFTAIEKLQDPYKRSNQIFNGFVHRQIPLAVPVKTTIAGIPALKYGTTTAFVKGQFESFKDGRVPARVPKTVELMVIKNKLFDSRVGKLMCRFYGIPQVDGLPYSFKYWDLKRDLHEFLSTLSLKPADIDPAIFKLPEGYSRVDTNESVYYDGQVEDGLNFFFK